MAEHILETRIMLRYGTFAQWMASEVVLKQGEPAIAAFPSETSLNSLSNISPENTPPAIGIKIGDGIHTFRSLPWVQAVAADVYQWAKLPQKPIYSADEITGLQAFVENLQNEPPTTYLYRLTEGTENNVNKFYLQYKENKDGSQWITDTNAIIDLNDQENIKQWVTEPILNNFPTLGDFTGYQIRGFISEVNYTDTPSEHSFVTAVSQTNGIISTSRARPTFLDIDGTLSVSKGGTGNIILPAGELLVGNGTDAITSIPISNDINSNNIIVSRGAIKSYIDASVANIANAMHFIGEATVEIYNDSTIDPVIDSYTFSQAQRGDVILYNSKEFVWDGNKWHLLGDESSYAIKGSITNNDISANAAIALSKIDGLSTILANKVNNEEGKGLSTNDYTSIEKDKLASIPITAQENIIEHIYLNSTELIPTIINEQEKSVNIQIRGLTQDEVTKLTNIENNAQQNLIEHIILNSTEIIPIDKTVTLNIHGLTPTEVTKLTNIEDNAQVNTIESISVNGVNFAPNEQKQVNITLTQASLNLDVISGAITPNSTIEVNDSKQLLLANIANTGNVRDLLQTDETYITFDCGSSTTVI